MPIQIIIQDTTNGIFVYKQIEKQIPLKHRIVSADPIEFTFLLR